MMYVYLGSGFGAAVFLVFLVFLYYRRQQAKKTNPLLGINVKKVIRQIHGDVHDMQGGELASYIPALSDGNPNHFAIAVCTVGGKIYSVGDDGVKFTIQSAAKPFMYAHLIQLQDAEYAKQKINVEPSGLAFNSDVLSADGRPFNPLINQGAIACCSLSAQGEDRQARYEQLNEFMSLCAGAQLHVDRRCYEVTVTTCCPLRLTIAYPSHTIVMIVDCSHSLMR
jgi:glutaminase